MMCGVWKGLRRIWLVIFYFVCLRRYDVIVICFCVGLLGVVLVLFLVIESCVDDIVCMVDWVGQFKIFFVVFDVVELIYVFEGDGFFMVFVLIDEVFGVIFEVMFKSFFELENK